MENLQVPGSVTPALVSLSQTAAYASLLFPCRVVDLCYLITVYVRVLWQALFLKTPRPPFKALVSKLYSHFRKIHFLLSDCFLSLCVFVSCISLLTLDFFFLPDSWNLSLDLCFPYPQEFSQLSLWIVPHFDCLGLLLLSEVGGKRRQVAEL